jgi:hypothetical protein
MATTITTMQITEQGAPSSRLYAYSVREFDTADGKHDWP